jgi:hypothetical protein
MTYAYHFVCHDLSNTTLPVAWYAIVSSKVQSHAWLNAYTAHMFTDIFLH